LIKCIRTFTNCFLFVYFDISPVAQSVPRPSRKSSLRDVAGGEQVTYNIFMFYTYVLRSKKDNKLYVGFSEDLKKRFKEHNDGFVEATKSRRPLNLIYYEACLSKEKAYKREKYFKTGFGRRFLKSRI